MRDWRLSSCGEKARIENCTSTIPACNWPHQRNQPQNSNTMGSDFEA